MNRSRKFLLALGAAVCLALAPAPALADGGPPTIPAEASVPRAPETPGAPAPSPTPAPLSPRRLAETGSNPGPLVAIGATLLLGGAFLVRRFAR